MLNETAHFDNAFRKRMKPKYAFKLKLWAFESGKVVISNTVKKYRVHTKVNL